jgi:hypothetical protein
MAAAAPLLRAGGGGCDTGGWNTGELGGAGVAESEPEVTRGWGEDEVLDAGEGVGGGGASG